MDQTSAPALARRYPSWLGARVGRLAGALVAAASLAAPAQATTPTAPTTPPSATHPATPPPDPADAQVAVPAVVFRSTLPPRSAEAVPVGPATWRDANDTAGRIGGWRAYLREAQTPEATPASTPTSPHPAAPPPRGASAASPSSPAPQAPSAPPPAAHKH